jgi:hypothetical protein
MVGAMATKTKKKKPSPGELLAEVKGRPAAKTYEFEDYVEVIDEMQRKDFSYAKIAIFLSERLEYPITRGQVYRAHQLWLEAKRYAEEQEREEEAAEAAYRAEHPDEDSVSAFDPAEMSEEARQEHLLSQAVGDVAGYVVKKYPEGSIPGSHRDLVKRVLGLFDSEVQDDLAAERADKCPKYSDGAQSDKVSAGIPDAP